MIDPLQDGKSSVALIDHMGDDLMVVNAARVSMAKESGWDVVEQSETIDEKGVRWFNPPEWRLFEKDKKLIQYLAKHGHWTPFSQPQIQLRIKMPIFIARQWYKHQVGFTRNEISRRYVSDTPELYIPLQWRTKAANVKQGSSDDVHEASDHFFLTACQLESDLVGLYEGLIDAGVCAEQARSVLPQSMYTEFVETGSLAAYARLCKLRLDPHAQKEIRLYAQTVSDLIAPLFPESWKALMGNLTSSPT